MTALQKHLVFIPLFCMGFVAVFGCIVMLLWNWLMPELFGLQTISFWQAAGLLVLCKILFGGLGGGHHHGHGCHHGNMSDYDAAKGIMTATKVDKSKAKEGLLLTGFEKDKIYKLQRPEIGFTGSRKDYLRANVDGDLSLLQSDETSGQYY